jgi:predicted DNA-binding transcriptional regulator YafY
MNQLENSVADLMADTNDRIGKTRRPLFRIYEIHAAIRGGSYPNCSQLAKQLAVQRKTIQRDITFMRDELKLPLVYEETLHGYYYDADVSDFPVFQTTSEELAGLFLARTALESVRGTPLAEVMQKVFAKLTRGMLGKIQFAWSDLDEAFSRKSIESSPRDVKLFGQIADAVLNQLVFPLNGKATRVEVRFEVGRLEEVLRWVLSFGSQAKVLGPPELVKIVRAEIEAMRG